LDTDVPSAAGTGDQAKMGESKTEEKRSSKHEQPRGGKDPSNPFSFEIEYPSGIFERELGSSDEEKDPYLRRLRDILPIYPGMDVAERHRLLYRETHPEVSALAHPEMILKNYEYDLEPD